MSWLPVFSFTIFFSSSTSDLSLKKPVHLSLKPAWQVRFGLFLPLLLRFLRRGLLKPFRLSSWTIWVEIKPQQKLRYDRRLRKNNSRRTGFKSRVLRKATPLLSIKKRMPVKGHWKQHYEAPRLVTFHSLKIALQLYGRFVCQARAWLQSLCESLVPLVCFQSQ